jgi:hypothetical protein
MQFNSAGINSLPIGIFAKPYSPLLHLVLQLKVPTFTAKYRTSTFCPYTGDIFAKSHKDSSYELLFKKYLQDW